MSLSGERREKNFYFQKFKGNCLRFKIWLQGKIIFFLSEKTSRECDTTSRECDTTSRECDMALLEDIVQCKGLH